MKNSIVQSIAISVALTGLSYVIGFAAGWESHLNWLEVFSVFTSYASTYLCVVQKRFNYVFGAVSSLAYSLLFFQSHLIASGALNFYLAFYLIYGWIRWRKDSNTRPVTRVSLKMWPVYLGIAGLAGLVGYYVVTGLGGKSAVFDTSIMIMTILAQILLDNKKLENWAVWFVMDVIATYVYFKTGLMLVGVQYILFTLNTVFGAVMWYRSTKAVAPQPAAEPAGKWETGDFIDQDMRTAWSEAQK